MLPPLFSKLRTHSVRLSCDCKVRDEVTELGLAPVLELIARKRKRQIKTGRRHAKDLRQH